MRKAGCDARSDGKSAEYSHTHGRRWRLPNGPRWWKRAHAQWISAGACGPSGIIPLCAPAHPTSSSPQVCCAILEGRVPEFNNNCYINILNIGLMYFKYILEDISLHRIFVLKNCPLRRKPLPNWFTSVILWNFFWTLDRLSSNVSMCKRQLGKEFATVQPSPTRNSESLGLCRAFPVLPQVILKICQALRSNTCGPQLSQASSSVKFSDSDSFWYRGGSSKNYRLVTSGGGWGA